MKKLCLSVMLAVLALPTIWADADAPLRVGEMFELSIGGVPSPDASLISRSYTVDGDGNVNLTYIGKVAAAGMTSSQFQANAERTYINQGIFTHPTISVNMAIGTRLVNVTGEVNTKGRVPWTADMTVMSAISAAGDFTIYANPAKVRLIRGNDVKELNCKKMRGNPSLDVKVLPGDSIMVPQGIF